MACNETKNKRHSENMHFVRIEKKNFPVTANLVESMLSRQQEGIENKANTNFLNELFS